ncbi:MAG: RHS repeat-associated core domain-containing protein, partial [Armatimonadota bacterium]
LDDSNVLLRNYARGLDVSLNLEAGGGIGGLLAIVDHLSNKTGYYLADGNGNIVDVLASDSTSGAHYEYDPFGSLLSASGTWANQPYQWSSKEYCSSTQLQYYGYRYYSAELKRWLSRDPIGELGGLNLYSFVYNDPVNYFDAFGLKKLSKEEGAEALKQGLSMLETGCDNGCAKTKCGAGAPASCTPAECKLKAKGIIDALVGAQQQNYGNGPHDDSAEGSDTVGGYFCWDWARFFENALSSQKPKCATYKQGMAAAPSTPTGTPVHFYLIVQACGEESAGSRVNFDDGFFDGENTSHSGGFPGPGTGYTPEDPSTHVTRTWPPYAITTVPRADPSVTLGSRPRR